MDRLMEALKDSMPLDKDEEFERARDALLAGNLTGFEAIKNQVRRTDGASS